MSRAMGGGSNDRRRVPTAPSNAVSPSDLLGPLNDVEAKNAPSTLYVAGDVDLLRRGARVSVVGSRRASATGLGRAKAYARGLVEADVVVVSGLAEGVDRAAHEGAIEAGGKTVAVLGSGLDVPFPASNRDLLASIIRDHLAVSQFPPGTRPRRGNFPMRNRVMALLTDATIVVEAGEKSGTRHQGWEALRLGRTLFLDVSVAEQELTWVDEMVHYGAQIIEPHQLAPLLVELPQVAGAGDLPF